MGNSSCCSCGPPPREATAALSEVEALLREYKVLSKTSSNTAIDVRGILLLLWKGRDNAKLPRVLSDLLAFYVPDKETFKGIEFYLPQFVHLMLHVHTYPMDLILEELILLVSQQSLHIALKVFWILLGSLEDYQPELESGRTNPSADSALYERIAILLSKIESSVVYLDPLSEHLNVLLQKGAISKAEFQEAELADRRFRAHQLAAARTSTSPSASPSLSGKVWIRKVAVINGKEVALRPKWMEYAFTISHRTLWCYHKDKLQSAVALSNTVVVDDNSELAASTEHPGYFELRETGKNNIRKYKLSVTTAEMRERMTQVLRNEGSAPPEATGYLPMPSDTQHKASPLQVARYGFFKSERDFIRSLTDICEELRFVDRSTRKAQLREKLGQLRIPGCVYLPICASTDRWRRVESVIPRGSTAFSTKERCPCLMAFRVGSDPIPNLDVANYLYLTLSDSVFTVIEPTYPPVSTDKAETSENGTSSNSSDMKSLWLGAENPNGKTEKRRGQRRALARDCAIHVLDKEVHSRPEAQPQDFALRDLVQLQQEQYTYIPSLGMYTRSSNITRGAVEQGSGKSGVTRLIAKSNDDLRQEVFIMQLIQCLHDIWLNAGLPLYLRPYNILSTSQNCGMLEYLTGTKSIAGVKRDMKRGEKFLRLIDIFKKLFPSADTLNEARRAFTESVAGYALATYIFGIKDRHNGNIMLETSTGRIVHIDFGFVLGMAPGKDKIPYTNFSLERAPFKLTSEMVEVMGGLDSPNWKYFNQMLVDGILEARKYEATLVTLIEIMGYGSKYPCFVQPGLGVSGVVRAVKKRLMTSKTDEVVKRKMRSIARSASHSKGTVLYEYFQFRSQKIPPTY